LLSKIILFYHLTSPHQKGIRSSNLKQTSKEKAGPEFVEMSQREIKGNGDGDQSLTDWHRMSTKLFSTIQSGKQIFESVEHLF
jgi:hypothetical protein